MREFLISRKTSTNLEIRYLSEVALKEENLMLEGGLWPQSFRPPFDYTNSWRNSRRGDLRRNASRRNDKTLYLQQNEKHIPTTAKERRTSSQIRCGLRDQFCTLHVRVPCGVGGDGNLQAMRF